MHKQIHTFLENPHIPQFPETHITPVIAIPSYGRSKMIWGKTIRVIRADLEIKWPIYIFVVPEEEELYEQQRFINTEYFDYPDITKEWQGDGIHIVVGKKGMKNQRNFIADYFDEGKHILHLDDDLDTIGYDGPWMIVNWNMNLQILSVFNEMEKRGLYLCGVRPCENKWNQAQMEILSEGLFFCVGPMYLTINRKDAPKLTLDEKEDVERSLQYYERDGNVMRCNYWYVKSRYYSNQGGMQINYLNRKEEAEKSAWNLHTRYPQWCRVWYRRPNLKDENKAGRAECRLRVYKWNTDAIDPPITVDMSSFIH